MELGEPPTQHAQESQVAETPRESSASESRNTAVTVASLPVPPECSPSLHGEGEAFEDGKDGLSVTLPERRYVNGRNLNNTSVRAGSFFCHDLGSQSLADRQQASIHYRSVRASVWVSFAP